ncbi:hypothetical protein [Novosphingobium sp. SCN 63-17]|uniref:hypothetical protein n=1 Tax=Novosphingobium sp. SCN 63-17 TaxID=1660120 RepID=UPI00260049F0|nr:hypothetical protein [Novosphingobium sp. SCN 63-17]
MTTGDDMGNLMTTKRMLACGGLLLIAGGSVLTAQNAAAPVARYEMRAGTISGMAGMRGGGMGAALGMAFGGGGGAQHELWLELGSSRTAPDGKPRADHFMPAGARLGKSVALKTPERTPSAPGETHFERPTGRMLIFWGCGEHAPKGQPVIIDFAKVAAGQMPPGLWSSAVPLDRYVTPANSRTYGQWPSDDGKSARPDSSLIGAHRIAGNYAPDINFTLTKDFMGALQGSSAAQPGGATLLRWNALPGATGYHASIIGGKQGGRGSNQPVDIVWWSSSATREFGGGLADWLAPSTVARLVANRTVLSPQTTTCTVPAEVKQAAPDYMFGSIYAYGPEEDFAYPPRPADPKIAWKPEWTARIRHRSMTGFLVGMEGLGAANGAQPQRECPTRPKKRGLGGLGGLIGGALGAPTGGQDGC